MVIEPVGYNTGDLMSETTDQSEGGKQYGTAELNDRGRLTIPKSLREDLQLEGGVEFTVLRENGDIRLVREIPELQTLTRDEAWGEEAFRDSGEATFGDR